MKRYDALNAVTPGEAYRNATLVPASEGSFPNALGFDAVMTEIENAIAALGGEPSNDHWNQLATSLVSYITEASALADTGVAAGSAGSSATVATLTVDAKGRVTSMVDTAIREALTSQTGILALLDATGFNLGTDASKALTVNLFAQYNSSLGYIKLPGGIIIQWGSWNPVAGGAAVAVSFPIAFTAAAWTVVTGVVNATTAAQTAWFENSTVAGFSGRGSAAFPSIGCRYIAIGK